LAATCDPFPRWASISGTRSSTALTLSGSVTIGRALSRSLCESRGRPRGSRGRSGPARRSPPPPGRRGRSSEPEARYTDAPRSCDVATILARKWPGKSRHRRFMTQPDRFSGLARPGRQMAVAVDSAAEIVVAPARPGDRASSTPAATPCPSPPLESRALEEGGLPTRPEHLPCPFSRPGRKNLTLPLTTRRNFVSLPDKRGCANVVFGTAEPTTGGSVPSPAGGDPGARPGRLLERLARPPSP
jgi:hypothetical protein